jgi:uncharacterized protein (TIGR02466 family)
MSINLTIDGLGNSGRRAPFSPPPMLQRSTLFPTTIWQARLGHLEPMRGSWIAHAAALRKASPESAGRTNRQGWNSSDLAVLSDPVFALLNTAITQAGQAALRDTMSTPPAFTLQSWINIHDRNGFNHLHMHEGCLLSGCFYLQVPEGSGKLAFRDPRAGARHSLIKGNGANAHMDVHLTPSDNLLVLFPAWLEHLVEPHGADTARIAIAFNLIGA